MDQALLRRLTHRPKDANKYDFGHVLILGGSAGMVGAPLLSGKAALRVGAGLVTIASDTATVGKLDRRVEEIMTLALPAYSQPSKTEDVLLKFMQGRKVNTVVIGPGLVSGAADIVRLVVPQLNLPTVLDAGGLAAFYGHLPLLRKAARQNPQLVITPHSGEYAKLTGISMTSRGQFTAHALRFANDYRLTVVLKGSRTFVASPDGSHYENITGNPGLATAGTGDVLTGVIAGLLAQGSDTSQAASAGVYLHGLAADQAAQIKTEAGIIASDIIEFLPAALKKATEE